MLTNHWPEATDDEIARAAARVGYPVLVKAVAGGGGKGMRVVARPAEMAGAIRAARSEAATSFGDSAVYLERRLARPRHIEVQLRQTAWRRATVCRARVFHQRRHQKVVGRYHRQSFALRARLAELLWPGAGGRALAPALLSRSTKTAIYFLR
jgi:acetyl/propionyl-CoA carboxylase alpha subunit